MVARQPRTAIRCGPSRGCRSVPCGLTERRAGRALRRRRGAPPGPRQHAHRHGSGARRGRVLRGRCGVHARRLRACGAGGTPRAVGMDRVARRRRADEPRLRARDPPAPRAGRGPLRGPRAAGARPRPPRADAAPVVGGPAGHSRRARACPRARAPHRRRQQLRRHGGGGHDRRGPAAARRRGRRLRTLRRREARSPDLRARAVARGCRAGRGAPRRRPLCGRRPRRGGAGIHPVPLDPYGDWPAVDCASRRISARSSTASRVRA